MNTIRVRFAPSPTGHLHIGGLRTALFNWLFARHHHGTFLLRIEDTDRERSQASFVDSQLASLKWAGINSDEPLVFQSQRMSEYQKVLDILLAEKKAYRCFCVTAEGLSETDYLKYDGTCRRRKVTEEDLKRPHAIRMKVPIERETITFHDLVRGEITFPMTQFDDFVIVRSDGMPVYNFVVVVDDNAMNISHIIRGEDHIPNTPKQIFIYEALGWRIPQFAHVPLILGPSGQRLSKREAATSVIEYKEKGYLPEALCNYLVRLGWSHGDQELFSREELINIFSLHDIGKSNAIFDQAKLDWMNNHYMKAMESAILLDCIIRDVNPAFLEQVSNWSKETVIQLIGLYKERCKTLGEMAEELIIIHNQTRPFDDKGIAWLHEKTHKNIKELAELLTSITDFNGEVLTSSIKSFIKEKNLKFVEIAQPLRYALIGNIEGPGIFELLAILGKNESLERIEQFLSTIEQKAQKYSEVV